MTIEEAITIVALSMSQNPHGTAEEREACQIVCEAARQWAEKENET